VGLSISWIAVQGKSKDEVLGELELVDTGASDQELKAELSVGCSQDVGW
jgi:hypothetical protein